MYNDIISYMNKQYGCDLAIDYYADISVWRNWWQGFYEPFHRIRYEDGEKRRTKDMFTMKMAKKVCEDWASILINDKTYIKTDDDHSSRFLLGDTENGGVLGSNRFWDNANALMESMMWSGTAAVIVRLKNAAVDKSGRLTLSDDTRITFDYLDADKIIPLTCENGIITEAAFCSSKYISGRVKLLLEVHRAENGKYLIENHLFDTTDGFLKEDTLPENVPPVINTDSELPWFAVCTPAIVNPIDGNNGMGCSVFYNAIDNLKGVDLAFNNFCSDIWLGQKKVFLSKNLLADTGDKKISPDEVNQQLFYYVSETLDDGTGKPLVQEHNPDLRVEANAKAVQSQLDYLSFKVGFGTKHYQFNNGTVVTATQYAGDKQDLIQNAHKHFIRVESFLHDLIKTVLYIGKRYIDPEVNDEALISVTFDQSPLIDENTERERDRQDIRDGIMAQYEYRMKWYGESEENARAAIEEIQGETEVDLGFGDGGDA